MTEPEKELIEEKFKGLHALLHARFENVEDRLDRIEEQTTKTNGRVTKLEDKQHASEIIAATHVINCPNVSKIKAIEDDLLEYKFSKKYPKIFYGGIFIIIIISILTIFDIVKTIA